jgi:hypothetical protein
LPPEPADFDFENEERQGGQDLQIRDEKGFGSRLNQIITLNNCAYSVGLAPSTVRLIKEQLNQLSKFVFSQL